ncbi:MAG: (d)CMP kinase [Flavobacteriales bacterium]|nr:(d)CMP kinase [Flavobacteriales bacterium]
MSKKITIAIDGYSSTGKSTIAKQLAKVMGYVYVDSGAMYRAMTLFAMNKNWISEGHLDKEKLLTSLDSVSLSFELNPTIGYAEIFLNGVNVENQIRTLQVSNLVSKIAAISQVRKKMVTIQKKIGKDKGVVMDGRDIGTVVFPDAELKLFMTSSAEIRAQRRYDELIAGGQKVSFEEVFNNVVERDRIDTTRADSPLIKAEDAIEIDNSHLTKEEQFKKVLQLSRRRLGNV